MTLLMVRGALINYITMQTNWLSTTWGKRNWKLVYRAHTFKFVRATSLNFFRNWNVDIDKFHSLSYQLRPLIMINKWSISSVQETFNMKGVLTDNWMNTKKFIISWFLRIKNELWVLRKWKSCIAWGVSNVKDRSSWVFRIGQFKEIVTILLTLEWGSTVSSAGFLAIYLIIKFLCSFLLVFFQF